MGELGWAPVGARLLHEYSVDKGLPETGPPTVRYAKTWREIKALPIIPHLADLAVQLMQLLHAVDCFPQGGLCQGAWLKEALRRYERVWLPLLVSTHAARGGQRGSCADLVPPLDVAFMWLLHRLDPDAYAADCAELKQPSGQAAPTLHVGPGQAAAFSDGSDAPGAATAALWRKAHPGEPFWPPAPPGAAAAAFRSRLSADLAAVAVRVPVFTHQLLRAAYNSRPFLNRAVDRYAKFLLLRKHHLELQHPIPPIDVALMWATHRSASAAYAADSQQLLQRTFLDLPGASASLWLERDASGPWRFHFTDTQRAWLDEFDEPFVVPASGYVPLSSPHPLEASCPPALLAAFEEGSSSKDGAWRAGAHALFLSWLQNPNLRAQQEYAEQLEAFKQQHAAFLEQQARAAESAAAAPPPPPPPPPEPAPEPPRTRKGGGLFACFGCGAADADADLGSSAAACNGAAATQQQLLHQQQQQQPHGPTPPPEPVRVAPLSDEALAKLAAGFKAFKHLPLTSQHPYWKQLAPRGQDVSAEVPREPGAEVEVFVAAQPASRSGAGALRPSDARLSDQDLAAGDYEVEVAGGAPLVWGG